MASLRKWIDTNIERGEINYFEYNNFSTVEKIGEGVSRANWINGGIKVALKRLNNSTIDINQKEKFRREVSKNYLKFKMLGSIIIFFIIIHSSCFYVNLIFILILINFLESQKVQILYIILPFHLITFIYIF